MISAKLLRFQQNSHGACQKFGKLASAICGGGCAIVSIG